MQWGELKTLGTPEIKFRTAGAESMCVNHWANQSFPNKVFNVSAFTIKA